MLYDGYQTMTYRAAADWPEVWITAEFPSMDQLTSRSPLFIGLALVACWVLVFSERLSAAPSRAETLYQAHAEAHRKFAAGLEEVAVTCDQDLPVVAAQLRLHAVPFLEQTVNVDDLPKQVQPDDPPGLPEPERAWRGKLRKLRSEYTNELFRLSRLAIQEKQASLAFRLIREVAFQNPDHPQARTALGYVRDKNHWTTPFAAEMKRKGKVWHPRFGWIAEKDIPQYEAGLRLYGGQWITAEKEALARVQFKNAWIIQTEHFQIRTNHSLERGCQLADAVEAFHAFFKREFAAFFSTPQQIEKLLEGNRDRVASDLYEIHHFRTRDEFVTRLKKQCPSADQINGIYIPTDRVAYFFHNPETTEKAALETLYHEVTHQLLGESSRRSVAVGIDRDFWVIEGIACYLESFHRAEDGKITVGDRNHPRVVSAHNLAVVDKTYDPLVRFAAMGQVRFQQANDLSTLQNRYAQATGLTHFFMHHDNGIYREGLITYLSQIYSPDVRVRSKAKPLDAILNVPSETIDREYMAYISELKGQ